MSRVLVIDDDSGTAELLRVVLVDAGHEVTVATTPSEIVNGPYDCIVTDLMGVAVYTLADARDWVLRLADLFPGVPVILVTGHGGARRERDALGVRAVVMKPFDVDAIVRVVRDALD